MQGKKLVKKDLNPNIYLSDENKKLQNDEFNRFLIWSIPAVVTCLWKTALCEKFCYARKAEIQYKDALPCRLRSLEESKKETFVNDMIVTITYNLSRPLFQGKKVWFRIHESGDFYSLEYLKKWIEIARACPTVNFLAYTKAVRLVELVKDEFPSNFVIRYSVWADTKPEELEIANKLQLPIYTAYAPKILDQKVREENYNKCDCDCQLCKNCYSYDNKRIAVAIH